MWHIHNAFSVFYNPTITVIGLMTVEMAEHVTRIGEIIDAYIMLFGRPGGKNLRGRPRTATEVGLL
jgi:hypothetical protein